MSELDTLRASHRAELAERLRNARDFGPAAENDDLHAVLEDAAIDRARIARLEEFLRFASIVEHSDAVDGTAGLGSSVLVEDEHGATARYALIGRRSRHSARHEVTPGSPVGKALKGARSGDTVQVELPSGRVRQLRVLEVEPAVADAPVCCRRCPGGLAWAALRSAELRCGRIETPVRSFVPCSGV